MKITFLGTGTSQGVPVIACECEVCKSSDLRDKRLRCSVLIETEGKVLVIDTGPDFRQQMLRAGVTKLDAILYTHSHKDHIAGMDDVRAFNLASKAPVDLYTNQHTLDALKREFYYAFEEHKYPGVPDVRTHLISGKSEFEAAGVRVRPLSVFHYQMEVLGFRIGDFTYITDANLIPDPQKELIRGSKVFVVNALRRSSHVSHFSLDEAVALSDELGAERTYFIHMSHQMGLHAKVSQELPDGKFLAYDGLTLEIERPLT